MIQVFRKFNSKEKRGVASIEVIVASAIILVVIATVAFAFNLYLQLHAVTLETVKARFLENEGIEVARYFRDMSYSSYITPLNPGTTYYLTFSGAAWATTTTPQYVDGKYLRSIKFATAYRNGASNLATSGTTDPDARKVTVTVSWADHKSTSTRSMSAYVINIFNN